MPKRVIKESQKNSIIALSDLGYANTAIAKLHDCDETTIRRVKKEFEELKKDEGESEVFVAKSSSIDEIKDKFSAKCEFTLDRIFSKITDRDVEKASLKDKAITIGILSEKMSLYKGLSTSNVSVAHTLVQKVRQNQSPD